MRICFAVDDGPEIEEAFEFYYGRFSKHAFWLVEGLKAMLWLAESALEWASVWKPVLDTIHYKANEIIICHISKNAEAEINQLHLGACKTVADHEGQRLKLFFAWTVWA